MSEDFVSKGYVGKLDAVTNSKLMFLSLAHRRNVSPMSFALMMAITLETVTVAIQFYVHFVYNFPIDAAPQFLQKLLAFYKFI